MVDEFKNKKKLAKHFSLSLGSPAFRADPHCPQWGWWGGPLPEQVRMLSLSLETEEGGRRKRESV